MPRTDRGRAARRGLLVLAVCGLACATAVAMAIREWRAAIDPVAAAVPAAQGSGARAPLPAGAAPTLLSATATAAAGSAEDPALPSPIHRRHRRGHRAPGELAAVPLRALAAQLTADLRTVRPQLAACLATGGDAMPRSLRLDVETGDGEARIVGVPALTDDAAFYRCAEQTLRGRTVASPGAKAGRHTSMVVPL